MSLFEKRIRDSNYVVGWLCRLNDITYMKHEGMGLLILICAIVKYGRAGEFWGIWGFPCMPGVKIWELNGYTISLLFNISQTESYVQVIYGVVWFFIGYRCHLGDHFFILPLNQHNVSLSFLLGLVLCWAYSVIFTFSLCFLFKHGYFSSNICAC